MCKSVLKNFSKLSSQRHPQPLSQRCPRLEVKKRHKKSVDALRLDPAGAGNKARQLPAYEPDAGLCQTLQHEDWKCNLPSILGGLRDRFGEALLPVFDFGLVANFFMDLERVE